MENTMTVDATPETPINLPVASTPPDISLNPADFQKELAKIADEKGLKLVDGNAVPKAEPVAVAQPTPTQVPAAAQPEVPEKFKTPEGQVDVQKVEKSILHADDALKLYREKETELRKQMQTVHNLQTQVPAQSPQQFLNPQAITPEAINQALEQTKNPGQVLLQLQQMTYQAAYNQALADARVQVDQVNARLESDARGRELQAIANIDPWVFSNEGMNKLTEIRQQYPWINQSPEPWKEAYDKHLALQAKAKLTGSVQMPNPTAQTVMAPATPVGAVPQAQKTQTINIDKLAQNPAKLNAYLNSLSPAQQDAFWSNAKQTGAMR